MNPTVAQLPCLRSDSGPAALRRLRASLLLALAFGLLAAGSLVAAQETATLAPSDVAVPRTKEEPWMSLAEWRARHEKQLHAPEREKAALVVLGDSIFEGWFHSGSFQESFGQYSPLNLAIGGDQTQHVLWRIEQGALDGLDPRLVVTMIGVNNLGNGYSPEQTVTGILAVTAEVRRRLPNAEVLLLSVLPAGETEDDPLRRKVTATRELLAAQPLPVGVTFLDLGSLFLEADGRILPTTMADFLHPTPAGQARLTEALAPRIHALMSRRPRLVVPLWPDGAPGSEGRRGELEMAKDWWVKNIHDPSITVFLPPPEKATGAAVVVCPGGGHRALVFNSEGVDAAVFLNSLGVAAFTLKYRLAREEGSPYTLDVDVRADAYRALRLVRSRASEWGVDPSRVGMLGFSAGGEVVSLVAYDSGDGEADAEDPIDRLNGRPDFQMLVYPGPLFIPDVVPPDAPPAFVAVANDDECCSDPAFRLLGGYRAAGRPIEAHFFSRGGHAFNMGDRSGLEAIRSWPRRMADWMVDSGLLDPAHHPEK